MQPSSEQRDYAFLTAADASVAVRLTTNRRGARELQLLGNRAGLLSLANTLLWLWANESDREFLALGELPFVRLEGPLSVLLRKTMGDDTGGWGCINIQDRAEQLEWSVSDDDLRALALGVHYLACRPDLEYTDNPRTETSEVDVLVRMTDAVHWL